MQNDDRHIGFSHRYFKLYGQSSGTLLQVKIVDVADISSEAIDYDTAYDGGRFEFDPEEKTLLRLVFIGDKGIPFTTYRADTAEHRRRFFGGVDQEFNFNFKRGS